MIHLNLCGGGGGEVDGELARTACWRTVRAMER